MTQPAGADPVHPDKEALRTVLRRARRARPPLDAAAASARLCEAALTIPVFSSGPPGGGRAGVGPFPCVAAFQPTNGEPDITGLLRALADRGWRILLPRPVGAALEWVAAERSDLVAGLTGIPRPTGGAVARGRGAVTDLGASVILVPALAVNPATGTRLGYGAGFYDRLLHGLAGDRARVTAVGVCFADELAPVPEQSHDEPVDVVVTDGGWRKIRQA